MGYAEAMLVTDLQMHNLDVIKRIIDKDKQKQMNNNDPMNWIDREQERRDEEQTKGYFNIVEGKQEFVLLSHCAPLKQVFDPSTKKYRAAQEGDTNISFKGVCWVLQDGIIKQAKLPYSIVKEIRGYQQNPDWEFKLPFPHSFTLNAKGAGTKEVEYSIQASPKKIEIAKEIIEELSKKPTPEDIVEKIKNGKNEPKKESGGLVSKENSVEYPKEPINPDDIPF